MNKNLLPLGIKQGLLAFALLGSLTLSVSVQAQTSTKDSTTQKTSLSKAIAIIKFDFPEKKHKNNQQERPTTERFIVKNEGSVPFIITNIAEDCDCIVTTWPQEPINPGMKADIKVTYNSI